MRDLAFQRGDLRMDRPEPGPLPPPAQETPRLVSIELGMVPRTTQIDGLMKSEP